MDLVKDRYDISEIALVNFCEKNPDKEGYLILWIATKNKHVSELSIADLKTLSKIEIELEGDHV